jgi:hypothetical protein
MAHSPDADVISDDDRSGEVEASSEQEEAPEAKRIANAYHALHLGGYAHVSIADLRLCMRHARQQLRNSCAVLT